MNRISDLLLEDSVISFTDGYVNALILKGLIGFGVGAGLTIGAIISYKMIKKPK